MLFLEMSEERPTPVQVERWLRNYGLQGAFDRISGLMFGRPRDYSVNEQINLDATILRVVRDEFGAKSLPIITNFDVGHTEPQLIVPLGVLAELDCQAQTVTLCEPWLRPADGS
jgi:muramoyltetrapeptide carboxypeptidase LdcA involved in peptidoglycan recycling